MIDVFSELAELEADRSKFLSHEWLKVARLAARNRADVGTVTSLLSLTGRSVAEFRAEVDHIRRITELRAEYAKYEHLHTEAQAANQAFLEFSAERQARFAKDAESIGVLTRRKQLADATLQACLRAKNELEAMGLPLVAEPDQEIVVDDERAGTTSRKKVLATK
ncbi:MAG: hypothetical protein ACKV2Q_27340 [Planctomycetaceae bacterium]